MAQLKCISLSPFQLPYLFRFRRRDWGVVVMNTNRRHQTSYPEDPEENPEEFEDPEEVPLDHLEKSFIVEEPERHAERVSVGMVIVLVVHFDSSSSFRSGTPWLSARSPRAPRWP